MNFEVSPGGNFSEGFCVVKTVDKKVTAKGLVYLDLMLSDSDGEINGKIWDYNEATFGTYEVGDLVKVRGIISQYQNKDQLKIERIRKAAADDNVNPSDFVKSSEFSAEDMYNEIFSVADSIKNENIKAVVTAILKDYKEKLLFWPAAFKLHHAMRGGLLYHTLSILRLCQQVVTLYPFLNTDLLYSGTILHDIAKIDEFKVTELGVATGYTAEGNLIGHLVKGAIIVDRYCEKLNVDGEDRMLLQHMLISHHGEPEFGAAVRPMFMEAEVLSSLDTLDAKIYEMADAVFATEKGEFSQRLWALNDRRLYNHGREASERKVNLL